MSGVINFPAVFNVWAQGAAVYQDPMAVAGAVDAAEVLGVHHFDLLVDAYTDASPQEGSELGRLYQGYLKNVVAGKHAAAVFQKRQLAGQVHLTDGEKWLEVVEKAGRRVLDGSAFFKKSHRRFFLETLRGRSVEAPPNPATVACSTDIAALRSLAEGYYQPALVRLETLIQQGDTAALEVGRTMNPRTIENSGGTPMSQWWLATLAEWGNIKAVRSLTRLKEGGGDYAEEMLADINPTALARRAEADEKAKRAVMVLAIYNHRAMRVLGDWILEGNSGYGAFLWAAAYRDTATTRAIDEVARVAGKNFKELEWLFRLEEAFAIDPGGHRYRRTLDHLQSYDLGPLAPAARKNILAFYWLVKLGNVGHPNALNKAAEAVGPLEIHLSGRGSAAVRWMLSQVRQTDIDTLKKSPHPKAPPILEFLARH